MTENGQVRSSIVTSEPEDAVFNTFDLNLASYLLLQGYRILSVDNANPHHVSFVFTPVPSPEVVMAFEQGQAIAEVRSLLNSYRRIKGVILRGGVL